MHDHAIDSGQSADLVRTTCFQADKNNALTAEPTIGLKINQSCGYTLDIRWANPRVARRPLGAARSKKQDPAVPRSVSTYGFIPPAVSEALHYHQHCFADIAAATNGCRLNPLRAVIPLVAGSVPLQHAMILLTATHRQQSTFQLMNLRSKALKTFAETLPHLDDNTKLAVILVLLFTDFVHSGRSPWSTHLSAVATIMRNMYDGKDQRSLLEDDSHRAMVLQLYWFDTISALLLARQPILPVNHLEDALCINEDQAQSTSDSLTFEAFGFTERMFLVLSCIVRGYENSIEEVQAIEVPDVGSLIGDGWTFEDAAERIHMEEIWKHATINYQMTRLPPYRWPRRQFEVHAQKVFEHASCLAPSSAKRRRILFPLLFAGSCTPYSERGDFMRRYCVGCFDDTKFGVFQFGLEISQQVWMLRAKEEEERKRIGGRAYSCWRSVTTGTDIPLVNSY